VVKYPHFNGKKSIFWEILENWKLVPKIGSKKWSNFGSIFTPQKSALTTPYSWTPFFGDFKMRISAPISETRNRGFLRKSFSMCASALERHARDVITWHVQYMRKFPFYPYTNGEFTMFFILMQPILGNFQDFLGSLGRICTLSRPYVHVSSSGWALSRVRVGDRVHRHPRSKKFEK